MQSLIPPSSRLLAVGLNHRSAPLSVRETLAFSPAQLPPALARFQSRFPSAEVVILSTCNRVEIYVARPLRAEPSLDHLVAFLSEFHSLPADQFQTHLYHLEDRAAVEHLFRVASSLDSMVVGETQILAQVKHAYAAACQLHSAGSITHALFQRAIAAAKNVHDSTGLSAGRLSLASVAIDLARSVFDRFHDKTVLCIGAGKMAGLMLKNLQGLAPQRILITNRSLDRAQAMAAQFHATAAPIDTLDSLLTSADIILTSTGATVPLLTVAHFKSLLKPRRYRPAVIIDLAVPRDVEAAVGELDNVYLYNVDDLQDVASGNRDKRASEIAASEKLLHTHVEDFLRWFSARDVGPLVKALYEYTHDLARAELDAHFAQHPELTPAQRADLDRIAHRLIGKILHGPVTQLTTHTESTARPMLAAALKRLFNLNPPADQF